MIYLNNAATSFPKPEPVKEALLNTISALPPGQFRSSAAAETGDVFDSCRKELAAVLGIGDTGRIFFTSGSTEALNALFTGLAIPAGQIITTVTEHNSVLRPLYNLPGISGQPHLIPCDPNGFVDPELIEREIAKGGVRAIVINHCSNVTGAVQDAAAIGEIARKNGLLYILDVSQSAGTLPLTADRWHVDALAFTGHKSLMGVPGTGGFYIRDGLDLIPWKYGGTGTDSRRVRYTPGEYEYEPGTQNAPGISALLAALRYIRHYGPEKICSEETALRSQCIELLSGNRHLHLIGTEKGTYGPVLSMRCDCLSPADLAYILQNSYGIVTRAGLQCAPLIHPYIGSEEGGTLRVSFSHFSTEEDIRALSRALEEIL